MSEWDGETKRRIEWFKTAVIPDAPFQFRTGVKITDSTKWRAYLQGDIDGGPDAARCRTGALQSDLEQLEKIIVHGLRPPAMNPPYLGETKEAGLWLPR